MKRANRRRVNRRVEQKKSLSDRVRPLKSGVRSLLIAFALVGAGLSVYEFRDHLKVDDGLILNTVEISGQYRASEEEILMYSGLERGLALLEVDLDKVARAVRAHPWVKHVTVRRQLVDKSQSRFGSINRHSWHQLISSMWSRTSSSSSSNLPVAMS